VARVSAVQRRRELTDAAVALILEEGPHAVTARKIAERAGASLASVHYSFRDMDELMHAANIEVLDRASRTLVGGVRSDGGVRVLIEELLQWFWHYLRTRDDETLAFFETVIALMRPQRAAGAWDTFQHLLVELMSEAQRHDPRPPRTPLPQLALLLIMAVDGLALFHLACHDDTRTTQELTLLVDALQHLV
jgi:TetR/AcrR family transcriptional regulator, regulator of biofilm formation and stress response